MKMNLITDITRKLTFEVKRNSPAILTGMAAAGVVTTTVMAVKATPKAMLLVDSLEEKNPSKMDILKVTWRVYVPTALMASVTIGCMIGANHINIRRNAAIAGLYSITEKNLKDYQDKVIETIGKNKESIIKEEIVQDKLNANPVENNEVILTGNGEMLCYDELSGRYFKSDVETLRRAMNDVNRDMRMNMWVLLNEWYNEIGLEGIALGDDIGWDVDRPLELEFTSKLTSKNEPCLVVEYYPLPSAAFLRK